MGLVVRLNGMVHHRKVTLLILATIKSCTGVVSVRSKRVWLVRWIRIRLGMLRGHCEWSAKACPGGIGRR